MQSLTNNVIEIELFGKKLLLSERTARDVNTLQKHSSEGIKDSLDALMQSAVMVRDALKINLFEFEGKQFKWWQFRSKKKYIELSAIVNTEKILSLPMRVISNLSLEVLKLEGIDVEAVKKKMMLEEREGLAVTLQTESSAISSI